ncbi:MAG: 3-dehydroquinate synthase [Polyangia bacterium]
MSQALILAGPPGAGKTTVGRLTAARLGWDFVDTDEELARRGGAPVAELFARRGEAAFRADEAALVRELGGRARLVLSTGGGLAADPERRQALKQLGPCVCLQAPLDELLRRLGPAAAARPLLRGDVRARLAELLAARASAYRDLHYELDTVGRTPESLAAQLAELAQAELERLPVRHPGGRYDIVIGRNLLKHIGIAISRHGYTGKIAVLSDTNVAPLYADTVVDALRQAGLGAVVATLPAGEASKRLSTVEQLADELAAARVERGGAIVALGGGVVGDVAGLVAATYQRGVALVQVPTSLLAMADSSIGGKVGVDTRYGKNLIGAFKQPELVFIDLDCLATLPDAERASGLAEVVKAGLIGGGDAWDAARALAAPSGSAVLDAPGVVTDIQAGVRPPLSSGAGSDPGRAPGQVLGPVLGPAPGRELDPRGPLWPALRHALQVKRALVEEDPYEAGRRVLLNLGHTFGHALEAAAGYAVRHGEAVAVGLVAALELSRRRGLCAPERVLEVRRLLGALGLPTAVSQLVAGAGLALSPERLTEDALLRLGQDKKRRAGRGRFVLIRAPGEVHVCDEVEEEQAAAALRTAARVPVEQGPQEQGWQGATAAPGRSASPGSGSGSPAVAESAAGSPGVEERT